MSTKPFKDIILGKLEFMHDVWSNVDTCDEDEPIISIVGDESGPAKQHVEKAHQLLQDQAAIVEQAVRVLDKKNVPEIGPQNGEIVFDGFTITGDNTFDIELGMSESDDLCVIVHFDGDTPLEYSVVD